MIEVLTIQELERVSGVPRTTIHYYLRQGLLPRSQKTGVSRSLYTERHVELLGRIAELKKTGLTIAQIEAELQQQVDEANETTVDLAAQERQRTHDRILTLATQELVAKGYKNTHVTSIMRRLDITATLFYSHFPSKRRLMAECVSVLMDYSLAYSDEMTASLDDPAERLLWDVYGQANVFELGLAAFAAIRAEGVEDDEELCTSIEDGLAGAVERIRKELTTSSGADTKQGTPDELIALSLFGAFERTAMPTFSGRTFTRTEVLRARLWLFLAAQAARNGEIDIESRVATYDGLIARLAGRPLPLPPRLQER